MTKNTSDILKYSDNASLAKLVFRVFLSSYTDKHGFFYLAVVILLVKLRWPKNKSLCNNSYSVGECKQIDLVNLAVRIFS